MHPKKHLTAEEFGAQVGLRIRAAREADGGKMSQSKLGSMIGQSDKTISSWERGITFPTVVDVKNLSLALERSISWLLGLEEKQPASTSDQGPPEERAADENGVRGLVDPRHMPPEESNKTLAGYFDFGDRVIRASLLLEAYGPPARLGRYSSEEPRIDKADDTR